MTVHTWGATTHTHLSLNVRVGGLITCEVISLWMECNKYIKAKLKDKELSPECVCLPLEAEIKDNHSILSAVITGNRS